MKRQSSDGPRRGGVQSVDMSGHILNALCDFRHPVPLKELAEAAGMAPAKAHRYVTSLVRIGLAAQDDQNGRYSVGPLALRLGIVAIEQHDPVRKAGELLQELCMHIRTSGHLAVWGERGPVLIRNEHGGPPVLTSLGLGTTLPLLRSATGRVYLGYMRKQSVLHLLKEEKKASGMSDTEIERLRDSTRQLGYARISGGLITGLNALSVPVFHLDQSIACTVTLISADPAMLAENSSAEQFILERQRSFQKVMAG